MRMMFVYEVCRENWNIVKLQLMLIFSKSLRVAQPLIYFFGIAKPKKQKTYYQVLEVPQNATPIAIKKNYIKLAKIYHPDVYKGADKSRFIKIQEAYKILSNQGDRGRYDETIGIKETSSYQEEKTESPASDSTNDYGKANNTFRYTKPKVEINLDEEYEKFFKKKSTTQFQQIRLHEQTEFKAMSQKERIRRRFSEVYPDLNLDLKMRHSKSYSQILDDQINQKNVYEEEEVKKKAAFQQKYSPQAIVRKQRYSWIAAGVALMFILPYAFSLNTKLHLEREAKMNYEKKMFEMFQDMEAAEIRERLEFK